MKNKEIMANGLGREQKEYILPGEYIAVLVVNRDGHVLLVQENHVDGSHHRQQGHWNIITETHNDEDATFIGASLRAISEEVTKEAIDRFRYVEGTYVNLALARKERIHGGVFLYNGDPEDIQKFSPMDSTEITGYRWASIEEIFEMGNSKRIEPEVIPFVHLYLLQGFLQNDQDCGCQ